LSVIRDANALIVLALDRQRAVAVEELLRVWKAEGEELHAPVLLRYEIASALAQAVSAGQLMSEPSVTAPQVVALAAVGALEHPSGALLGPFGVEAVVSAGHRPAWVRAGDGDGAAI
jgi:hypothetical protein